MRSAFASVTPYPAYPGAAESLAYRVTVDGQPVFVHRLPTYNQFQWMDHASFAMSPARCTSPSPRWSTSAT